MHVVITGATGAIGQCAVEALEASHALTLIDRRPLAGRQVTLVDLADPAAALAAIPKADVLIHLAAIPTETGDYADIVRNNVLATPNVCEAARVNGVARMVIASTIMVYGRLSRVAQRHPLNPACDAAADTHYGCSKLHAESLGAMYARRHGLSGIGLRFGWFPRPGDQLVAASKVTYMLSVADAKRLFVRCVEAPHSGWVVINALSRDGGAVYDLEPGRQALGFDPHDSGGEAMRQHLERRAHAAACVAATTAR
jgi:uronate dehydrogenase